MTAPEGERPGHYRMLREGVEIAGDELPLQRAARGQRDSVIALDMAFEDGEVRHLLGNAEPILGPDGRPRGAIAVYLDVTADREARDRAAAAEHRLVELIGGLDDPFVVLDRDWRYTYANARAAEVPGLPVEAMIGRSCWEVLPEPARHRGRGDSSAGRWSGGSPSPTSGTSSGSAPGTTTRPTPSPTAWPWSPATSPSRRSSAAPCSTSRSATGWPPRPSSA